MKLKRIIRRGIRKSFFLNKELIGLTIIYDIIIHQKTTMIRKMESWDVDEIALIHERELSGFLPEIGQEFLKLFYEVSLALPLMFTFVETDGKRMRGFVSSIEKTKGLYKQVLLRRPVSFGFIFLKYFITHPQKLSKFIKILAYPGFSEDSAELLSIAVDKNHRRKGVGRGLFNKVHQEFKKRGIKKFKISVYDRLPANGFYLKIGCRKIASFDFLGEKMNYYEYSIS